METRTTDVDRARARRQTRGHDLARRRRGRAARDGRETRAGTPARSTRSRPGCSSFCSDAPRGSSRTCRESRKSTTRRSASARRPTPTTRPASSFDAPTRPTRPASRAASNGSPACIEQLPPAYSAKSVDGVRAYAAARRGAPLELSPVSVVVHEWTLGARVEQRSSRAHHVRRRHLRSRARARPRSRDRKRGAPHGAAPLAERGILGRRRVDARRFRRRRARFGRRSTRYHTCRSSA